MISVQEEMQWNTLEQSIRAVPLLQPVNGEQVYPYEHANIALAEIRYSDVNPTSLYVLRENLAFQAKLREDLNEMGYDPLALATGLWLRNRADEIAGLLPPIVEETEQDGKYVLDGAHRTSIGRWMGRTSFAAIHITNIRPDCPAYAYPNPWDKIRIMEETPTNLSDKKRYRDENFRQLYRDFSVLNGGKPRSA